MGYFFRNQWLFYCIMFYLIFRIFLSLISSIINNTNLRCVLLKSIWSFVFNFIFQIYAWCYSYSYLMLNITTKILQKLPCDVLGDSYLLADFCVLSILVLILFLAFLIISLIVGLFPLTNEPCDFLNDSI